MRPKNTMRVPRAPAATFELARRFFLRLRQPTLLNRLVVLLLIGTGIAYTVAISSLWITSARLVDIDLQRLALQWVVELDNLGAPIFAGNARRSDAIADRIKNFPEVAYVRYFDQSGERILNTFGPQPNNASAKIGKEEMARLKEKIAAEQPYLFESRANDQLRVLVPVRISSIRSDGLLGFDMNKPSKEIVRIIGFIELGMDGSFHKHELRRGVIYGSLITAVIFLIALAIGRRVIRQALNPLLQMQAPLARLAKGDTSVTISATGDAEIVAIGNALNATIAALRHRDTTLRDLAERDSLTGLYNRRYFSLLLEEEIAHCRRDDHRSALFFIDLDRFKSINDTLGHPAGDRLLIQLSDLIKGRVRGSDVVARFGGDEFVVLARNTNIERALQLAQSITEAVGGYLFTEQDHTFPISCSVGVTEITAALSGPEEALTQVDLACYQSKMGGRNRCHLYEPKAERIDAPTPHNWPLLIKNALTHDGFKLLFQPIHATQTRAEPLAVEALLRLIDADGEAWPPHAFFAAAERSGTMGDIDRWAIAHAIAAAAASRAAGTPLRVFVNLSRYVFQDASIVQFITATAARHTLSPTSIVFEIDEQTAVRYLDQARSIVQSLIDAGFQFSLSNFGLGLTNCNYLKHLPVTYVKLDGALIERFAAQPVDRIMVQAIARAAHVLDKRVIAQHVEDQKTLQLLKEYGVDYVQGNLIAQACELAQIERAPGPENVYCANDASVD